MNTATVNAPALHIAPRALTEFLAAAAAGNAGPSTACMPPDAPMHRGAANVVAIAGIAAAGACAGLMRPSQHVSHRTHAARWAIAAPVAWGAVHTCTPSWAAHADLLATLGVGWLVFVTTCLALRHADPSVATRAIAPIHLAAAALAAVSIGLMWHDAVLPSTGI